MGGVAQCRKCLGHNTAGADLIKRFLQSPNLEELDRGVVHLAYLSNLHPQHEQQQRYCYSPHIRDILGEVGGRVRCTAEQTGQVAVEHLRGHGCFT